MRPFGPLGAFLEALEAHLPCSDNVYKYDGGEVHGDISKELGKPQLVQCAGVCSVQCAV